MMSNHQIETLKTKLREAGVNLRMRYQFNEPGTSRFWTCYIAFRQDKPPQSFVIVDHGEDGYVLLVEASSIRIDDDVALILGETAA